MLDTTLLVLEEHHTKVLAVDFAAYSISFVRSMMSQIARQLPVPSTVCFLTISVIFKWPSTREIWCLKI